MYLTNLIYTIAVATAVSADASHKHKCNHKKSKQVQEPIYTTPPPPPVVLQARPVAREGYKANSQFYASYVKATTEKLINADFEIKALRPTINFHNFPMINKVECGENDIKLNFDSSDNAQKAFKAWSATPDLAFYIGHEFKCGGEGVNTRGLDKVKQNGNVLVIDTHQLKQEDVIEEYTVNITQSGQQEIEKRGFKEWWDNLIHPKVDKTFTVPLNVNYDKATQSIIKPIIPLLPSNKLGSIDCVDCHTRGDANLRMQIKATLFIVNSYSLSLFGDFNANIDIAIHVNQFDDFNVFRKTLFAKSLLPVSIPGIFNLGPAINLDTAISLGNQEPIDVSFGYDLKFPFHYEMKSDNGLFAKPEFIKSPPPVITQHEFKHTEDIQIRAAVHLIPAISLNLQLFKVLNFGLSLDLDNSLGVQFSTGRFRKCPEEPVNIELYHQHAINLVTFTPIKTRTYSLFDTGRLEIHCFFCKKCFPGSRPTLTLPASTTTKAITTTTTAAVTTTTTAAITTTTTATVTTTTAAATTTKASTTTVVATTTTVASTTTTGSVAAITATTTSEVKTTSVTTSAVHTTSSITTTTTKASTTTTVGLGPDNGKTTSTTSTTTASSTPTNQNNGYARPPGRYGYARPM